MKKITNLLFSGNARSVKANKNIIASFGLKGLSIIVGFLMVRVVLDYLDQTKYGIWLTLTSFLSWFTFFEIGLGSGLKNKLAEALANGDTKLARIYVSTTYAILFIVIAFVALVFFVSNIFINWTTVLNTEKSMADQLTALAFIVFGFFFMRFVIKLIGVILTADQRPAVANSFGPIGNLISLILIWILTKYSEGSLIYLGFILSSVPILVLIVASFYFYTNDYKNIAPSIQFVDFNYAKDLLNLGVKFFIIQIVGLVMFQTSNIIIAQFFGPGEVTRYNIAYKYFSILNMVFAILITPFWSAFTEAWVKNDIEWIKKTVKRLLMFWILLCVVGIIMLAVSSKFYILWIGDTVTIPFNLSLVLLIYFASFTFGGIFNMFINGVGKIKLQMYFSFLAVTFFISFAIIFIKYFGFGIEGLVIAMILSNFFGLIIAPIQYYKIINKKAKGIWDQ